MDILSSTNSTILLSPNDYSTTSSSSSSWTTNRYTPVYLSCIAGASTCLGAAVVFLHPKKSPTSNQPAVSNATMSFSLALAGSVMITVSVVSIGGECLRNDVDGGFIEFSSWQFWQRLICFMIGCGVYLVLSKCAFPEPEELIEQNLDGLSLSHSISAEEEEEGCEKKEEDVESGESREVEEVVLSSKHTKRTTTVPSKRRNNNNNNNVTKTKEVTTLQKSSSVISNTSSTASASSMKNNFVAWTKGSDLQTTHQKRAWRLAMLLFLSLLLHNFPEGLAVAASALESPSLGITVTIGIMIHNIPEGIAIAIPCLAARPNSPWLSFLLASASGLAEPAGAFLALLCLENLEPHEKVEEGSSTFWSLENVLAFVAGIMITVACWELFPEAKKHTIERKVELTEEKEEVQVVERRTRPFWCGTVLGVVIMLLTEFYAP